MDHPDPGTPEPMVSDGGATEGCGCVAPALATAAGPPSLGSGPAESSSTNSDQVSPVPRAGPPRRSLKLVVTLHPAEDAGYRAALALGSTDCDPLFRGLDVPDLATALAAVDSLLGEAQARWRTQPRYPNARPIPRTKPRSDPEQPAAESTNATTPPAPPTQPNAAAAPAAPAKSSGQLPLFG